MGLKKVGPVWRGSRRLGGRVGDRRVGDRIRRWRLSSDRQRARKASEVPVSKFALCEIDCACARAFALTRAQPKRFSSPARAWHIPSSDWALAAVSPRLGWVSQSRRQATWSDSPPAKECPGLPASLPHRRRPGRRRGAPRRGRGCRTRPRVRRAMPARQQRRSRGVPTSSLYADEPPGCLRSKRRTDDESGSSAAP